MNLQGTITSIVPDGGYQSQSGYINTFQMSINTPTGLYTGQIGSKSNVYPLGVGEVIMVDMTESQNGVRFKKVDPKFAKKTPQFPQVHQAPPLEQRQMYSPPQNAPQQPTTQNDTQLMIIRQTCVKAAVDFSKGFPETSISDVINNAETLTRYCLTGEKPDATPFN